MERALASPAQLAERSQLKSDAAKSWYTVKEMTPVALIRQQHARPNDNDLPTRYYDQDIHQPRGLRLCNNRKAPTNGYYSGVSATCGSFDSCS